VTQRHSRKRKKTLVPDASSQLPARKPEAPVGRWKCGGRSPTLPGWTTKEADTKEADARKADESSTVEERRFSAALEAEMIRGCSTRSTEFKEPEMEAITQLVAESLARHGFDRPVDPRRLQWSRWFRCDSPHSLLVVPSKPGIFAIAEEIMDLGPGGSDHVAKGHVGAGDSPAQAGKTHVETPALGCPERSSAASPAQPILDGAALQRCDSLPPTNAALAAEAPIRRMLAVLQFSEDDDMAFTLDRMLTRINPMRARLATGRCFVRFVVIEDHAQRRSICAALNQWMLSSSEKASGIGMDFQSSLELTDYVATARMGATRVGAGDSPAHASAATARVGRTLLSDNADRFSAPAQGTQPGQETSALHLDLYPDSGANKNLHCPHPLPSGF
jgi:hypothetical protein